MHLYEKHTEKSERQVGHAEIAEASDAETAEASTNGRPLIQYQHADDESVVDETVDPDRKQSAECDERELTNARANQRERDGCDDDAERRLGAIEQRPRERDLATQFPHINEAGEGNHPRDNWSMKEPNRE